MPLFISRHFVDSLPEDPFAGILAIIAEFRSLMAAPQEVPRDTTFQRRRRYWIAQEACALLSTYLEREAFDIRPPQLSDEVSDSTDESLEAAVIEVAHFMNTLESDIKSQTSLGRSECLERVFGSALRPAIWVKFSGQDLHNIRRLLDLLREPIRVSPDLSQTQRCRLLGRIDRLAGELRPQMPDLSLFWGFVIEMSLLVRPPSEDVPLLAPKMKELFGVLWSAQARAFGLSPNTPFEVLG